VADDAALPDDAALSDDAALPDDERFLVVLTGLSGAGRSVAAGAFEDLNWFVIDNLPVSLVPEIAEIMETEAPAHKMALVLHGYDDDMAAKVEALRREIDHVEVVFLDAAEDVLIRRYVSTKRRHPLLTEDASLSAAIADERHRLERARSSADLVIDTSNLNPHQLREQLTERFGTEAAESMRVTVSSFGFKHGIPLDADMVIDCRFLPNPHWDEELRPFSGRDAAVRDFVLDREITQTFLDRLVELLDDLLPAYVAEGKAYFTLAFGCTGGRHRSVAVSENIAARLAEAGWAPRVAHRDIDL
jgi:UPF0042 nucleotide-binding protein